MERAATPGNLVETQWVVVAIASGLIGVVIVAMIIYLCCFNNRHQQNAIQRNGNRPKITTKMEVPEERRNGNPSPNKAMHHPYFYPPPSYEHSDSSVVSFKKK